MTDYIVTLAHVTTRRYRLQADSLERATSIAERSTPDVPLLGPEVGKPEERQVVICVRLPAAGEAAP